MKRSALTIFDRTSEPDPPNKTPEISEPKPEPAEKRADARLASWYAPGLSDGLGDRLLMFDNSGAPTLELLRFKPEFSRTAGFEGALKDRVEQLSTMNHPAFAKVRDVKHLGSNDGLALVSNHVEGRRLSEILEDARGAGYARALLCQITPALAALQRQGHDIAHGTLSPERIVVTPDGRLVITEHVVGGAIESLNWSAERVGSVLNLVPTPGEQAQRSDVVQLGAIALSLLQGKRVDPATVRNDAEGLIEAVTRAHAGNPAAAADLIDWIKRALQIGDRKFATAIEAHQALFELPAPPSVPALEGRSGDGAEGRGGEVAKGRSGEVAQSPRRDVHAADAPAVSGIPRISDPVWRSQYEPDESAPRRSLLSRLAALRARMTRRVEVSALAVNLVGVLFGVQLVIIAALVFSRPADQFTFQIDGVQAGTEVLVDGQSVGASADPSVRLHLAAGTQSVQVKVPATASAGSGRATNAKSTAPRPAATSTPPAAPAQSADGVSTMSPAQPPAQQGFFSRAWHFSTDWIGTLYRKVKYSLSD